MEFLVSSYQQGSVVRLYIDNPKLLWRYMVLLPLVNPDVLLGVEDVCKSMLWIAINRLISR